VGGLCLDGTADRAEVHGLFFDFEAELLREGGAHDVDGAGVEDGLNGPWPLTFIWKARPPSAGTVTWPDGGIE
jgi:hypothetical protein